ncbi:tetratricopeptide repeat protein [Sphingomonas sp. ASY06-1R]|uniref:tetratricopeptide repeat protein n=1 Tax=Sphingomonas sp. ASY06-1R TaxID=3445771 RepID=UPI003FA209C5
MPRHIGKGLAALLGTALLAMPAAASEWWFVNTGPGQVVFIDAKSIERKKDNVTYWTMYVIRPGKPEVMMKTHMRANCTRRTLSFLGQFKFDAQGRQIGQSPTRPSPMQPVPPDSLGDAEINFACGDDGDHVANDQFRMEVDEVKFAEALLAAGNKAERAHDLHDALAGKARPLPAADTDAPRAPEVVPLVPDVQVDPPEPMAAVEPPSAPSEEAQQLTKDCAAGDAPTCRKLGRLYAEGDGVGQDAARAATLYDQGCKAGDAHSCTWLGIAYVKGEGVAKDDWAASAAFARACEKGGPADCTNIALAYATGEGVPKDSRLAAQYFKAACDHGDAAGCSGLGASYILGGPDLRKPGRARGLFKKGCAGGDSNGCYNLGVLYEQGIGMRKDPVRAIPLYERACGDDVAGACGNLGSMVQSGTGVTKDAARAAALFEKACDLKGAEGCFNAGRAYQAGSGVERDTARAAQYYRRALEIEPDKADARRALTALESR